MNPAANHRRGLGWEADLLGQFRHRGHDVEQLHLRGKNDEGDLAVRLGSYHFVIEAKAEKEFDLAGYVAEARVEAENYARARKLAPHLVHGLAVVKAPRKPFESAYVVRTLADEFKIWDEGFPW